MLNQVPVAINKAARLVVLRHPNAIACSVWRKQVQRVEIDPVTGDPSEIGGMPTLGGMEVLKAEDEAQIDYVEMGAARVLFSGQWQESSMNERVDAPAQAIMQMARIECTAEPGAADYFTPDRGDLVAVLPGMGVVLAYSIEGAQGSTMIPPYVVTHLMQPRDELHQLAPWEAGAITPEA